MPTKTIKWELGAIKDRQFKLEDKTEYFFSFTNRSKCYSMKNIKISAKVTLNGEPVHYSKVKVASAKMGAGSSIVEPGKVGTGSLQLVSGKMHNQADHIQ